MKVSRCVIAYTLSKKRTLCTRTHCILALQTRAAAAAARAKEEHYRSALQALTLFKSRTQAALLQALSFSFILIS